MEKTRPTIKDLRARIAELEKELANIKFEYQHAASAAEHWQGESLRKRHQSWRDAKNHALGLVILLNIDLAVNEETGHTGEIASVILRMCQNLIQGMPYENPAVPPPDRGPTLSTQAPGYFAVAKDED